MARWLLIAPLLACLWDTDTIEMEQQQFPGIRELIAGKFTRHSGAYYEWRVRDRTARLAAAPDDLALTDDLAVACEKLGRRDEAIALARRQLEHAPDRYETLANLGTFLVHAGRHEEGLVHLRRAVEINPDAHFGRETIQIRLIEYVASVRAAGRTGLPLLADDADRGLPGLLAGEERLLDAEARDAAVQGVAGMMFFGVHDHPVLLECLGQLLAAPRGIRRDDARQLAARAYLRASYGVAGAERSAYRELAKRSLAMQVKHEVGNIVLTLVEVEEQLAAELEEGRRFVEEIAADEQRWAAAGLDLDAEFRAKYYDVGRPEPLSDSRAFPWERVLLAFAAMAPFHLLLAARWRRRRVRAPSAPSRSFRLRPGSPLATAAFLAGAVTTVAVGSMIRHPLSDAGWLALLVLGGLVVGACAAALAARLETRHAPAPRG